jgi:hypothetical protein
MANEEQLAILRQGAAARNAWREGNRDIWPDLSEADLPSADLNGASLDWTNLIRANLFGADLRRADLDRAVLGETILGDVDLSSCKGLDSCRHHGPSIIDHRTLRRSGPLPLIFLRGVGLPEPLIDYLPSLLHQPIQFYSCFVSYSSKDQTFAERLHAGLQNKGVRCWFAPEDLKIGDRLAETIDMAIRVRDKLLLILSETSVASAWVLKEVRTALAEEDQRGRPVLFPVRLDGAVTDTTEQWAHDIRRTRHIGDFTRWTDHDAYQKALERLLRDLKVEASPGQRAAGAPAAAAPRWTRGADHPCSQPSSDRRGRVRRGGPGRIAHAQGEISFCLAAMSAIKVEPRQGGATGRRQGREGRPCHVRTRARAPTGFVACRCCC